MPRIAVAGRVLWLIPAEDEATGEGGARLPYPEDEDGPGLFMSGGQLPVIPDRIDWQTSPKSAGSPGHAAGRAPASAASVADCAEFSLPADEPAFRPVVHTSSAAENEPVDGRLGSPHGDLAASDHTADAAEQHSPPPPRNQPAAGQKPRPSPGRAVRQRPPPVSGDALEGTSPTGAQLSSCSAGCHLCPAIQGLSSRTDETSIDTCALDQVISCWTLQSVLALCSPISFA